MVFYQQNVNKNKIFQQLALTINETYGLKLSQGSCFKLLYESSSDQFFLQSTFYQQKANKYEMAKKIPVIVNGICQ